jgi:phytoene/squalene synthetase
MTKAGELIDRIVETLGTSQYNVARLLNVDPHTLSNNRETTVDELTPKTKKKLISLYQMVREISSLRDEVIMAILQRHVFEDEDGRKDSVISAIQQDKYDLDILQQILETAQVQVQKQQLKKYPDVSDAVTVSA